MVTSKIPEKYGLVKRSVLRNLLYSMLTFGLIVGLIFPPFARIVLDTEKAYSPLFFAMCVIAGLIVGAFNFLIFWVLVSRELNIIQIGMNKIIKNIAVAEVLNDDCLNNCTLSITSTDIIGKISKSFNKMTYEIFKRLELEGETRFLNMELTQSVELSDVADTILKHLSSILDAKAGLLYGGKADEMPLLSHFGVDFTDDMKNILTDKFGPIINALKSGEILGYSNKDGWEWFSQSTPLGKFRPGSIFLIPLIAKQQSIGLVILACNSQSLSQKEKKSLENLRSFAAPYLSNSFLNKRAEMATIDSLTNIPNRRFGIRRLKEEFSRSKRHNQPISVAMVDIDHFKNMNDTFGHSAGDLVLKTVAATMQESLRMEDVICRYGGEEFLIVLPGEGLINSARVMERIRNKIENDYITSGNQHLAVTISCGIATFPDMQISLYGDLINAADKALYASKDSGRNRVSINDGKKTISFIDFIKAKSGKKA